MSRRLRNCWTCKYLVCLGIVSAYPETNFTHGATKCCPFSSANMISYHPCGIGLTDSILLDINKGTAWLDAGIETDCCEGWEADK